MEAPQTLLKTIPQLSLFGVSIAKEFSVLYRQDATKTLTRKPTESSETSPVLPTSGLKFVEMKRKTSHFCLILNLS